MRTIKMIFFLSIFLTPSSPCKMSVQDFLHVFNPFTAPWSTCGLRVVNGDHVLTMPHIHMLFSYFKHRAIPFSAYCNDVKLVKQPI